MTKRMLFVCIAITAITTFLFATLHQVQSQSSRKPMCIINLTTGKEDLHKTTMALQLAGHALDDGREVLIFANVRAPELFSKKFDSKIAFNKGESLVSLRNKLIRRGVAVHVCPFCAGVQGVKKEHLVSGAVFTNRDALFSKLTSDALIFSY